MPAVRVLLTAASTAGVFASAGGETTLRTTTFSLSKLGGEGSVVGDWNGGKEGWVQFGLVVTICITHCSHIRQGGMGDINTGSSIRGHFSKERWWRWQEGLADGGMGHVRMINQSYETERNGSSCLDDDNDDKKACWMEGWDVWGWEVEGEGGGGMMAMMMMMTLVAWWVVWRIYEELYLLWNAQSRYHIETLAFEHRKQSYEGCQDCLFTLFKHQRFN